jgi:stage V sporulation protein B
VSGVKQTISKSVLFACVTGLGAASLFLAFPDELGMVIYNQPIGGMLFALGLMCPFLYLQIIFSGILNGLGKQVFIFKVSLLTSAINIMFIYFLVPRHGIGAFILGWFSSLVIACALEIEKIRESVHIELDFINWIGKPILAAAASGLSMKWLNKTYITPLLGQKFGLALSVTLLVVLFCGIVVLCGVIDINDLTRFFRRSEKSGGSRRVA